MAFPATPEHYLVVICVYAVTGITIGNEHGSGVVRVVAEEGSDAILPCSLSTKENIKDKLFDWRKDGGGVWKEVFQYNAGSHYNNGVTGQDEQFRGRVSHFPEQLEFGNASIRIRNTTIDDRGHYTCDFPLLQPRVPIFNVLLVVDLILKDRSGQIPGAACRPFITISNVTEGGVQLQCVALGASPQPTLRWLDGDGKQLHADKPQISERGGRYDVVLQTTVTETKTSFFYCALEQEELGHAVKTSVTVPEKLFENKSCRDASMFTGGLFSGVALILPAVIYLIIRLKKGSQLESRPLGSQLESRPSGSQLESGPSVL